jgi:ribose-phosphate pyrophosphokinase
MNNIILFAGRANPGLAKAIAQDLNIPLGNCTAQQFPDGDDQKG